LSGVTRIFLALTSDYDKARALLSEHEFGIDMLDSVADASTLSCQTKVTFGAASRILNHYREWLKRVIEEFGLI
jgi:hypothetical protein